MTELKGKKNKYIILAAGCFWSIQFEFSKLHCVLSTQVGYTDGHIKSSSSSGTLNQVLFMSSGPVI